MKTMFNTAFFVLFLAGWGLAALSLHVVRSTSSISLVTKDRLGMTDTYCDTRTWTADDVLAHPAVVSRLVETNQISALNQKNDSTAKKVTKQAARDRRSNEESLNRTVAVTNASSDWWTLK